MPESKLREIADAADMIVSGFAFNKNGEMIRIVNLNKRDGLRTVRMDSMKDDSYCLVMAI
jgi:hypothetical protein